MKKKIALIGFGELGKQFLEYISDRENYECVFFDDTIKESKSTLPFKEYSAEQFKNCRFLVALGYHHLVEKNNILIHLLDLNRELLTYIHPTSFVTKSAVIGSGSFIYPMCNIDKEVKIGNGVLLNNSVCISHNSRIDDACYISPGVVISGNVEIGKRTFIGSGTVITNNVKIGNDVIIGAGSVITKNIPEKSSAIGNPMKILKKKLKLI